jgi:DNA-binding NarL/FixJ family response regulator
MIRVLLADAHALMREGLKHLFDQHTNITVVGEAESGAQVFDALRNTVVDLLLLDLALPDMNGVSLIERLGARQVSPPVLVLSMHCDVHMARFALKAGAAGYLTKHNTLRTLLEAVRKVAAGGRYVDPALAQQMALNVALQVQRTPHEQLSAREYAVFGLLARGRSVNEIAAELMISNKTVSTHKARLMQKMECSNNAQLIRYAVEHQLVP